MKRYQVEEVRREVVVMTYSVRAENEEEAAMLCECGCYDSLDADECQESSLEESFVTVKGDVPEAEAVRVRAERDRNSIKVSVRA